MVDFRHISWEEYGRLTRDLANKVSAASKSFDLVIGVARGGIPVAMVVSDKLGVRIDFINVKSYSGIAKRTSPRVLSTLTDTIRGKRVLLVDDLVDQGDTIQMVKRHLEKEEPALLETAVLFMKPWSKVKPEYFLATEDKWIVFPFEFHEVERLRQGRGGASEGQQKPSARTREGGRRRDGIQRNRGH